MLDGYFGAFRISLFAINTYIGERMNLGLRIGGDLENQVELPVPSDSRVPAEKRKEG